MAKAPWPRYAATRQLGMITVAQVRSHSGPGTRPQSPTLETEGDANFNPNKGGSAKRRAYKLRRQDVPLPGAFTQNRL